MKDEDWGDQARRLEPGRVWLNTMGTCALASAGHSWARLAGGVVVRLFCHLQRSGDQEILLFADDAAMFAARRAKGDWDDDLSLGGLGGAVEME